MRTTVTLDDDVAKGVQRHMRDRGTTFKQAVNDLLRRGLQPGDGSSTMDLPRFSSGQRPGVDLDRATALAAALEDDEVVRKLELRK